MKQNEKLGSDQYWDTAFECASALGYIGATAFSTAAVPPLVVAGLGFAASTSSTACIVKITSIASGQTVEQYTQLNGAIALLDPWGWPIAALTEGETLNNSAPTNVVSAGHSLTDMLSEKLSKPSKFTKADYFQIASDLIKFASSAGDVNPKQGRLLGVSLLDKTDRQPIRLYDLPLPKGKTDD